MSEKSAYDTTQDPPAPVLSVRVGLAGGRWSAALPFLVDTGADMTVVPARLVRELGLPAVGEAALQGATGKRARVPIYRAELGVGSVNLSTQVVAFGREMLLGRDVLNLWTVILRGKLGELEIEIG
ncbi:MAG TPA: retroviral-like aspartic protease family protein [bacterium]